MGGAGILGSFAPQELLRTLGAAPTGTLVLVTQLHAAILFGFAVVNWMASGSLLGGIYNRPLVVGNLAHFVVGALAGSKAVLAGERAVFTVSVSIVYLVFAIAFAFVLFRSPATAK